MSDAELPVYQEVLIALENQKDYNHKKKFEDCFNFEQKIMGRKESGNWSRTIKSKNQIACADIMPEYNSYPKTFKKDVLKGRQKNFNFQWKYGIYVRICVGFLTKN